MKLRDFSQCSLLKTAVCETGQSDCHKMVFTIFHSTFIRLPPEVIKYRNMNILMKTFFCHEVDQTRLKGEIYKAVDSCSKLT